MVTSAASVVYSALLLSISPDWYCVIVVWPASISDATWFALFVDGSTRRIDSSAATTLGRFELDVDSTVVGMARPQVSSDIVLAVTLMKSTGVSDVMTMTDRKGTRLNSS